jgi:hypothetical protein
MDSELGENSGWILIHLFLSVTSLIFVIFYVLVLLELYIYITLYAPTLPLKMGQIRRKDPSCYRK